MLEKAIKAKEKEVKKLNEQLNIVKSAIENLKKENNQKDIQRLKSELNQLAQEKISFSTRLENFEQFIAQVEET